MINDTISDMLTRIRNAILAKHSVVFVMNTKINKRICEILKTEGFIDSIITFDNENVTNNQSQENNLLDNRKIKLILKYTQTSNNKYSKKSTKACITNLKRLSSPGLRQYSKYKDLPELVDGMGVIIVSTSKGLMTHKEARLTKTGGELLCAVW